MKTRITPLSLELVTQMMGLTHRRISHRKITIMKRLWPSSCSDQSCLKLNFLNKRTLNLSLNTRGSVEKSSSCRHKKGPVKWCTCRNRSTRSSQNGTITPLLRSWGSKHGSKRKITVINGVRVGDGWNASQRHDPKTIKLPQNQGTADACT